MEEAYVAIFFVYISQKILIFLKRLTPDNHKQWELVKLGMLFPNMWVLGW